MILPGEKLQARGITEKETGSSLLSQELSKKVKSYPWLEDEEVEKLPGPIAYEYAGFKATIIEGNVEGACWKFTNLVQVILAYLLAVCLEDQYYWDKLFHNKTNINSASNKIEHYINDKHFHNNAYKDELIGVIKQILQWRNYYGVGHGTLTQSKGDLLVRLLELSQDFLLCFRGFNDFLEKNQLNLAGSKKGSITGRNYFLNVDGNEWYNRAFCNNITRLSNTICPVVFCGYQFDGPDIYFLDCVYEPEKTPKRLYRNFSRNRLKYFQGRHSFNIAWDKEPKQVAWLNKNERDNWCNYFKNNDDSTMWDNIVYAAATFQERGMYEEAEWCIKVYYDKSKGMGIPQSCKPFELELGIKLTQYSILAARGTYVMNWN